MVPSQMPQVVVGPPFLKAPSPLGTSPLPPTFHMGRPFPCPDSLCSSSAPARSQSYPREPGCVCVNACDNTARETAPGPCGCSEFCDLGIPVAPLGLSFSSVIWGGAVRKVRGVTRDWWASGVLLRGAGTWWGAQRTESPGLLFGQLVAAAPVFVQV